MHAEDLPTRGYLRDQQAGIEFQSTNRIYCKTRTHFKAHTLYLEFVQRILLLGETTRFDVTREQIIPYFNMLTNEMIMASDIEIAYEKPSEKEDNQVLDLCPIDIYSACVTGQIDEDRSLYG